MILPSEAKDLMGDREPLPLEAVEVGTLHDSSATRLEPEGVEPLIFPNWEGTVSTSREVDEKAINLEDELQPLREQIASLESLLAREVQYGVEMATHARQEGRAEGARAKEEEMMQGMESLRVQVQAVLENYDAEKQQYFRRAEREVVRLALAIAARVLHREAHMDPLLLAGAVRVAMEKLADASGMVLRVSPGEVTAWQEMFRAMGEARILPEVIADSALGPGECVLETKLGTVELGVRAQLEEIEKGFFDLLDQKPQSVRSSM